MTTVRLGHAQQTLPESAYARRLLSPPGTQEHATHAYSTAPLNVFVRSLSKLSKVTVHIGISICVIIELDTLVSFFLSLQMNRRTVIVI